MVFEYYEPGECLNFLLEINSISPATVTLRNMSWQGNLKEVRIPSTFEDVDGYMYELVSIGKKAFVPQDEAQEKATIDTLIIPDSVQSLKDEAFANLRKSKKQTRISKIVLPDTISAIPSKCFKSSYLKEIEFNPDKIIQIGESAFEGTYISSIVWPQNVKEIPKKCFAWSGIQDVKNVEHVTSIKNGAFLHSAISDLPNFKSIKYIQSQAFRGTLLKEVSFPKCLKTIRSYAFADCDDLIRADLSKVIRVGENSFRNCKSLCSVEWNPRVDMIAAGTFNECKSLKSLFGVEHVRRICSNAFMNTALEDLSAFKGLGIIEPFAFSKCYNFNEISISGNIECIKAQGCFSFCKSLKKVKFPSSTKIVDLFAFAFSPCQIFDFSECESIRVVYDSDKSDVLPQFITGMDTVLSLEERES